MAQQITKEKVEKVKSGSLTNSASDFRKLVEDTQIELDDVEARHNDSNKVIHEECDWLVNQFDLNQLLQIFVDCVDIELDEDMTLADVRHEVHREAVRRVKSEVIG